MQNYQYEFIDYALSRQVLRFGQFTLKSHRQSPYFFNAGLFNTGQDLTKIGQCYAQALQAANIEFDILFGPAYKGITIAASLAMALMHHYQRDVPYCFNRKETKDHGEGGLLVGAPLTDRVLVVDDVITAGTAINESMDIIRQHHATPAGILIALDRQEKGYSEKSAVQEVSFRHKVPVYSIITFEHLLAYLAQQPKMEQQLIAMQTYHAQYSTCAK